MALVGPNPIYPGTFTVTGTGLVSQAIGFKPNIITFEAPARVTSLSEDTPGGTGTAQNYAGTSTGFARWDGDSIGWTQTTLHSGGSGHSINHTSHYASDAECISIRYANNNGTNPSYLKVALDSVNGTGFTVNVTQFNPDVASQVVMFTAYRTQQF